MIGANPGYALGRLARALTAGDADKVETWRRVFEGMMSGALAVLCSLQ